MMFRAFDVKSGMYNLTQQLWIAIHQSKPELIPELIAKGADTEKTDGQDMNALMKAVLDFRGKSEIKREIIEKLLLNKANPNATFKGIGWYLAGIAADPGATPLMLLLFREPDFTKETKEMADLLLQHKADINRATENTKFTVLHYANALMKPEWIKYLEERGADKTAKNFAGLVPNQVYGETIKHASMIVPGYKRPSFNHSQR
jgi:ankyrin repeat protein